MTGRRGLAGALPALAALALLAAACAAPTTHWQKPGADLEDWSRDEAACRAHAHSVAEREFREHASQVGSPVYRSGATLEKEMAVHDARRRERALFETCMRAKGYSPAADTGK